MVKVLFCGLKYEYGKPGSGLSFEYKNFYEVLARMPGVEAENFPVDEVMLSSGRDEMNRQLIDQVKEKQYDLLFCFLFTDEIKKSTIEFITKKTKTKTFNWFADDHWRLPIYSRYFAPLFTMVSTTDSEAMEKYHALGINNVIKTQWGANIWLYKPNELKVKSEKLKDADITFVGKKYGNRRQYVEDLKSAGLSAEGYGSGWGGGRVSFEDLISIFSNSKINLNFTESPYVALKERFKFGVKGLLHPHKMASYLESYKGAQRNQIKGRTFEIPACGGFLLTQDADNLKDYYEDGREVVIFKNEGDMIEKSKHFLERESERRAIAEAGYRRTIKEHSYEQRFGEIFRKLGLY